MRLQSLDYLNFVGLHTDVFMQNSPQRSTLWVTAAMFSAERTGREHERVVLSNNDPVARTRFTNLSTNCDEATSFLPNFFRKFLRVWVEDSPV